MKKRLISSAVLFALLLCSTFVANAQTATALDTTKPLNGTYTVSYDNGDFGSMADAIRILKRCGVSGPVRILVKNGTYNSLIIRDSIPGSSVKNTITFRSFTGPRDSVRIYDTYGAKLVNTCHLRFEELTLEGIMVGVQMDSSVNDVEIRHCNILAQLSSNYLYKGIEYPGNATTLDRRMCNVRIIANNIRGGYVNIHLNNYCSNSNLNDTDFNCVTIDSNLLCDAFYYGFYSQQNGIVNSFSHNTVTNYHPDFKYYGLYSSSRHKWGRVDGNRIHINNNLLGYGLYFGRNFNQQNKKPAIICNNEIIIGDSSAKYGLYVESPEGACEVINNSILIQSPTLSYGLYLGNSNTGYRPVVYNNMSVNGKNGGYPIYIANSTFANIKYFQIDYNNYYSGGAYLAYLGSKKSTLQDIRNVDTAMNQHSTSIAPVWIDYGKSLEIKNANKLICPAIAGVTTDINGKPRLNGMNAMGCYCGEADSNDASLSAFADLDKIVSTSACPVKAVIVNAGIKAISSATITLWVDGVKKASVKYSPAKPLPFMQSDTVNLGSFQFSTGIHNFLVCVNMDKDANSSNDSIAIRRYVCEKPFSGTIVIGNSKSADFAFEDIPTLFNSMNQCGVNGDITLSFENGVYRGRIDLSTIATAMMNHHLTLTSKSKDRDKVTIMDSNNHILFIGEGNRNITVEHLTFRIIPDTTYAVIDMTGCENIRIQHNRVCMDTNSKAGGNLIDATYSYGSTDNLTFAHNLLQGGNWGINIVGNSKNISRNIVVDSNEFIDQSGPCISFSHVHVRSISHNVMLSRRNSTRYFYGMYIQYGMADSIIGNYIDGGRDTRNQMPTQGIWFSYMNNDTAHTTLVANNCIISKIASSYPAVHASNSSIKLYHNTIRTISTTANFGYAVRIIGSAKEGNHLYGNIIDATKAEYALYVNVASNLKPCKTDYNDYCNTDGTYTFYINGQKFKTLDEMRAAIPSDTHSVSIRPYYKNLGENLEITPLPQMLVPRLNTVKRDFMNRARPAMTLMGACESEMDKNDASLNDFSKTALVKGSSSPVYVGLVNMGSGTITSVTIRWTVNGVAQTAASWKGSLASRARAEVLLGNIVPEAYNEITAWVEKPNSQSDANNSNDTVFYKKFLCGGPIAAGSYTLGGYNPYFKDEKVLSEALYICGISGPVVIKVRAGIYGTLNLPDSIPGSSAKNTLKIVAERGEAPQFDGGSGDAGLIVNNLKYTTFQGLTFGNLSDGLEGVRMNGNCSHVTIRECNIYACTTSITSEIMALSYKQNNSSNYPVEVHLTANRISGGYYNLYLNQITGTSGNMSKSSMYIDSNEITNAFRYGIYASYYCSFPSISHNSIKSRIIDTSASFAYYGIYSYYYKIIGKIECNRILVKSYDWGYGIYFYNYQNYNLYTSSPTLVTNNEIMVIGSNDRGQYGIMATVSNSMMDVHHNSIYVKSEKGAAYGISLQPTTITNDKDRFHFTRNLLVTNGVSNYPIYFRNTNYDTKRGLREWNDFYSKVNVAYAGKDLTTIAELQAVTKQDSNSVKLLPTFADLDKGLDLKDYNTLLCPRIDSVRTDINGHQRNASTTIGCYATSVYSDEYKLKVSSNSNSMGAVAGGGTYSGGTRVKITANATAHHHFLHWNDGNRENPRYILIWKDTSFTATFAPDTHMVTLHSNDTNMGTVTGDGPYAYGATATLKADAKPDHHFKQWSDGNKQNPRQLTVTKDVELTAFFEQGDAIREAEAQRLTIYPNPVGKALFITNGERFDGASYEVADMTGRLVLRGSYNASEGINVEELADGIYLLRMGNVTGRFVK